MIEACKKDPIAALKYLKAAAKEIRVPGDHGASLFKNIPNPNLDPYYSGDDGEEETAAQTA